MGARASRLRFRLRVLTTRREKTPDGTKNLRRHSKCKRVKRRLPASTRRPTTSANITKALRKRRRSKRVRLQRRERSLRRTIRRYVVPSGAVGVSRCRRTRRRSLLEATSRTPFNLLEHRRQTRRREPGRKPDKSTFSFLRNLQRLFPESFGGAIATRKSSFLRVLIATIGAGGSELVFAASPFFFDAF